MKVKLNIKYNIMKIKDLDKLNIKKMKNIIM